MGIRTPFPREIIGEFRKRYESAGPDDAVSWYYDLCKKLNYVRAERIAKDRKWTYESPYGTLDITINRSNRKKIRGI